MEGQVGFNGEREISGKNGKKKRGAQQEEAGACRPATCSRGVEVEEGSEKMQAPFGVTPREKSPAKKERLGDRRGTTTMGIRGTELSVPSVYKKYRSG